MSMSKEDVCTKIDMSEFQLNDSTKLVNQQIMEGEKIVGRVLFMQPSSEYRCESLVDTSVGLALCDAYQPPQQPWKTGSSSLTVIQ